GGDAVDEGGGGLGGGDTQGHRVLTQASSCVAEARAVPPADLLDQGQVGLGWAEPGGIPHRCSIRGTTTRSPRPIRSRVPIDRPPIRDDAARFVAGVAPPVLVTVTVPFGLVV